MRFSTLQLTILTGKVDPLRACAVMLCLAAIGVHWILTDRVASLRDQARQELTLLASQPHSPSPRHNETSLAMSAFESVQVERTSLPEVIERQFSIAQEHRLELGRGEYRFDHVPLGEFSYYRITLPIVGRYSALRPFVETILAEWPGIALEQISFSRGHAGEPETEAVVRFALLVRD